MRPSTASYPAAGDFSPRPVFHPPDMFTPGPHYAPPPSPKRSSSPNYVLYLVVILLAGGVAAYWLYPRTGILQLSVLPQGAIAAFDGRALNGHGTFLLVERAGVHHLTVSSPGYVAFDRKIEISARQKGQLAITLKPSPRTGFTLTSTPPGVPVWLDGRPLAVDTTGRQANTDVHATGIAPGAHVIELRGHPQYQPWREEFLQEPDVLLQLHADLKPAPPVAGVPSLRSASSPAAKAERGGSSARPTQTAESRPRPTRARPESPSAGADDDIFEDYGRN
jgi:hypothetical protein